MPKSSRVALDIPARGLGRRRGRGKAAACWQFCEASRGCCWGPGPAPGCWCPLWALGEAADIRCREGCWNLSAGTYFFLRKKKTIRVDFFLQHRLDSVSSKLS